MVGSMETAMREPLIETYFHAIERAIDEKGVYPHQGLLRKGEGLEVHALALDFPELVRHFWDQLGESDEVIYGVDMTTRPGQGTRYADALVVVHWTRDRDKKLADLSCVKVGVINYQHEPRIVDPIDWDNSYWDGWVRGVFPKYRPSLLVRVERTAQEA